MLKIKESIFIIMAFVAVKDNLSAHIYFMFVINKIFRKIQGPAALVGDNFLLN